MVWGDVQRSLHRAAAAVLQVPGTLAPFTVITLTGGTGGVDTERTGEVLMPLHLDPCALCRLRLRCRGPGEEEVAASPGPGM